MIFKNKRKKISEAIIRFFAEKNLQPGAFSIDEKNKSIIFSFACMPFLSSLKKVLALDDWSLNYLIHSHQVKATLKPHAQIKNVVAIASGKGGVGKSTTAVNLALALKKLGANVGLLDADIYGPSQAMMLATQGLHPKDNEHNDEKGIPPLKTHGIQSISIANMLATDDSPMIWRGPMVSRALQQLFYETHWHALDYLIIDLPPGTGDIPLTLVQKIPLTASVIVTTPQDIALLDAKKAFKMFEKVTIPVLGVVENMASYTCTHCGHLERIFGEGGAKQLQAQYQLTSLGQLPLDKRIREQTDSGKPTVVAMPKSILANAYQDIAFNVSATLSLLKKDYSAKFGQIVVENSE